MSTSTNPNYPERTKGAEWAAGTARRVLLDRMFQEAKSPTEVLIPRVRNAETEGLDICKEGEEQSPFGIAFAAVQGGQKQSFVSHPDVSH